MSTATMPYRQPLGLPAGSIRAFLALIIVGLFWLFLLVPAHMTSGGAPIQVPLYMFFLFGLVLVFFAAHGHNISRTDGDDRAPWGLPRGFFRFVLVVGTLAIVGWQYYKDPGRLQQRLTPSQDQLQHVPALLGCLAGGFVVGRILRVGPWRESPWYQDILAWLALLASVGVAADLVIQIFINPTVQQPLDPIRFEYVLTAIIAGYFGART